MYLKPLMLRYMLVFHLRRYAGADIREQGCMNDDTGMQTVPKYATQRYASL